MHTDSSSKKWLKFILIIVLVVVNLAVGVVGGIAGFVLLTNNDSPAIVQFREYLGFNKKDGVAIPVKQTLRVEESSAIIDASNAVSPAVVSVSASKEVSDYFGRISTQEIGGGSGFIITSDGLVVTNKHVVDSNATYSVILSDGRILEAKVQAVDPFIDLAVLKIEAQGLPTVDLGSSEDLKIGQSVIAVGNALGEFKNSVTFGVISAKQRDLTTGGIQLNGLLQTDAAINPGNSGGPLVNLAGQVIGINTAIASTTGGSIGLGFAIPIDQVKSAIDSVLRTGKIERPYIGIRYVPVTKPLQKANDLSVDYGVVIARGNTVAELAVIPGSPAAKAGLKEGDIILEINGERVNENSSFTTLLQKYKVGETVEMTILSGDDQKKVAITLAKLDN